MTKIKASADVEATLAQSRAQVASAALGAATRAKVVPLMLVPGKLGKNARAEVAAAASTLVDAAAHAHVDKAEAFAEAAEVIEKAAVKKAAALAKADAKLDRAVAKAEKKGGRKVVELPGTGIAGVGPAVAPIVTPVPTVAAGGLLGGLANSFAGVVVGGGGFGGKGGKGKGGKDALFDVKAPGDKAVGAGVIGKSATLSFPWGGRRRLMQAQQQQPVSTPHGLTAGAALAAFGQAAMAFGAQLQQLQQQPQQAAVSAPSQQPTLLVPEAALVQQPYIYAAQQQQQQQQQQLQQQPYNPAALAGLAPVLASLGGAMAIPPAGAGAAAATPGALSPRAQALIGAISGGAGLALNAAAPLVRGVAAAVPVMVPLLDPKAGCVAGRKVKLDEGVFCVLGSWEPAAQALLNGAGLATAAAAPAANGVASLMAANRNNQQQVRGRGGDARGASAN
jgi:hypothetical protein